MRLAMESDYKRLYRKGWAYGQRGSDLDAADARGYTRSDAWCDGFFDAAASMPMWHRAECDGCDDWSH